MEDPDPKLVTAARRGDLHAFEAIVRRYQADVWRMSFHLLHDEALADDAVQETFVRVFRFLRRYKGDSKFSTWLFSVARNCALDEIRRSSRRRRGDAAAGSSVESEMPEHGRRLEVKEALAELPLELRESVVVIDMFGASYAEASEMLGAPVGTVKSRVHRARQLLAAALDPLAEGGTGEA